MVKAVSDAAVLSVREMVETALDKQDLAPLVNSAACSRARPFNICCVILITRSQRTAQCNPVVELKTCWQFWLSVFRYLISKNTVA